MHWQGKLRGIEFEPVKFRFEGLTSPDVKDVKGREVELPVLRPTTEADAEQRDKAEVNRTAGVLRAMAADPAGSLTVWATATGIHRSSVERMIKRLANPDQGKLAKNIAANGRSRRPAATRPRRGYDRPFCRLTPRDDRPISSRPSQRDGE